MIRLAALLALIPLGLELHDVHVSTARMAIEETSAIVRVRLFRNDLQRALREHADRSDFRLRPGAVSDSLFLEYARDRLVLSVDGAPLAARVVGSGEERERKEELYVWYYDVRFDAPAAITGVQIRNELLFELFHDQRNTIRVRTPRGTEKTIHFVPGEGTYDLKW